MSAIYYVTGMGLIYGVICGLIAASIAAGKHRSGLLFFCIGFVFGLLGIIVALVLDSKPAYGASGSWLRHTTPSTRRAGWYVDLWNLAPLRWHDGVEWTQHVTSYDALHQQPYAPAPGTPAGPGPSGRTDPPPGAPTWTLPAPPHTPRMTQQAEPPSPNAPT